MKEKTISANSNKLSTRLAKHQQYLLSPETKSLFIISVFVYIILFALMIMSTINGGEYDLLIDKRLFNPDLTLPKFFEDYGQAVAWAMWGPAFAIIFLCRRDLNGCLAVINRFIPAIKPVENVGSKAYKTLNFILQAVESIGFFVLCGIGWKKLIENVTKNILKNLDKENLSQLIYFIISYAVAATSIFLLSRMDKKRLKKLEGFALAGVLLGISFKIVEECKSITHRVRFREMIAYSNGFFNAEGLSEGRYSPLTRQMIGDTDFGAFSPWYRKSFDSGIYDYHLFNRTDSFPSGHTTNACMVLLSATVFGAYEKLKKFAPFILCLSVVFIGFMGYTRLIRGAHYLSDVVGAMLIGYTLFLAVNKIYTVCAKKIVAE